MEDKLLTIDSTKEEVADYFIKHFNLPSVNRDILIKEDISGDALPQLSQLTQKDFIEILSSKEAKAKGVTLAKLKNYLKKNIDKFKEKDIKEIITIASQPEEVKNFFDKCLNFQKDLNGLNGKALIELDEEKMKQLGLNLGQRFKLMKYINHFKSLSIDSQKTGKFEITNDSSVEEVANFLKTRLKFSTDSIDSLGFDGETFLQLKIEEIDNYNTLNEEERENLKKYLSGELKYEEEKSDNEPEITITNESRVEEVSAFLKNKLGFKKEAIDELDGFDGETLLTLTEEQIDEYQSLSHEEKNKLKELINNINSTNITNKKDAEINEKSSEVQLIQFIKQKLNLNELNDDTLNEIDIEKIPNLNLKEKEVLNNFIKEKKKINSNNKIMYNISDNQEKKEDSKITDFTMNAVNQNIINNEFIDFYFVLGINQKDYQKCKIYVQTQGEDKICDELVKNHFSIKNEIYFQILYNIKLKKNSKFCLIKIFNETYNNFFKCNNKQYININDEDTYLVLENLNFESIYVSKYIKYIYSEEVKPPKLFIQDFESIFSTYYYYILNSNKKNYKLINTLFLKGLSHINDSKSKYTITFFLQVLLLIMQDNNYINNKDQSNKSLLSTISLFNVNSLKMNKLSIEYYYINNMKQNLELLLKTYTNKNNKNDINIRK